ncbi:MAG: DNA primase [Bacteroidales bacterium]|nr:DNA primase [Bacteroidales bacterium]
MIDQATIARIRDAIDIVQVIGDFVPLKRQGSDYVACCPFHQEKTPSFHVSPSRQYFNCFGCHEKGNAITFLMKHEQMTYVEALKWLGNKYGIEVNDVQESFEEIQKRNHRDSLLIINEYAGKYFTNALLNTEEGRSVGLSYFRERGFKDETIREFQLGYANKERDSFTREAVAAGYKKSLLVELGLSVEKTDGPYAGEVTDKFHERVMFPIRSVNGKIVAFGGRILSSEKSPVKYMNSPESEIYHKKRVLYGLYEARNSISQKKNCYLVEGYTDVISMHQSGIENVVASCGTALTEEQVLLLKRFTQKITIIYDGDNAGVNAALKGINLFLQKGMNVKVVLIPGGEDPDSFARTHTREELEDFLEKSEEDFIVYQFRNLSRNLSGDPYEEGRMINEIALSVSMIDDAGIRSAYLSTASELLGIGRDDFSDKVNSLRAERKNQAYSYQSGQRSYTSRPDPSAYRKATEQKSPPDKAAEELRRSEQDLVYLLLKFGRETLHNLHNALVGVEKVYEPTVAEYISQTLEVDGLQITDPVLKKIYDLYFENVKAADSTTDVERFFISSMDQEISDTAIEILSSSYRFRSEKIENSVEGIGKNLSAVLPRTVYVYKSKVITSRLATLRSQLLNLDSSQEEEINELTRQIQQLSIVKSRLLREAKFAK